MKTAGLGLCAMSCTHTPHTHTHQTQVCSAYSLAQGHKSHYPVQGYIIPPHPTPIFLGPVPTHSNRDERAFVTSKCIQGFCTFSLDKQGCGTILYEGHRAHSLVHFKDVATPAQGPTHKTTRSKCLQHTHIQTALRDVLYHSYAAPNVSCCGSKPRSNQ